MTTTETHSGGTATMGFAFAQDSCDLTSQRGKNLASDALGDDAVRGGDRRVDRKLALPSIGAHLHFSRDDLRGS